MPHPTDETIAAPQGSDAFGPHPSDFQPFATEIQVAPAHDDWVLMPEWMSWPHVLEMKTPLPDEMQPPEDYEWLEDHPDKRTEWIDGTAPLWHESHEDTHLHVGGCMHKDADGALTHPRKKLLIWIMFRETPVESDVEERELEIELRAFLVEHGFQVDADDEEE